MATEILTNEDKIINKLISSIKELASSVIVKNSIVAKITETFQSKRDFDFYYIAYNKLDKFTTYSYTEAELIAVGVPNDIIEKCITSINNIPHEYHASLLDNKRDHILNSYVEANNYYRAMYGLPDTGKRYLYIPYPVDDIPTDIPIHLLEVDDISKLYDRGVIDEMIADNPKETYLKYLGTKKIHFYTSRSAKNLDIVYLENIADSNLETNFRITYIESREYVLRVLYDPIYEDQEYYNGIMGMFTLYTTIQRMITEYFNTAIRRDFFDMESIKNMFESYGVTFFEDIPIKYQLKILKNLNYLIKYKGTNHVLIDICKLFGLGNAEVYKYYLYKEHNLDANGKLLFKYNEDGTLDYDATYNLNYIKVPIDKFRIDEYIYDTDNRLSYNDVTSKDKYWAVNADPDEIRKNILKDEFNYIESKYISINNMYNITEMMFEVNYFMRMILDSYDKVGDIKVVVDAFGIDNKVDIFQAHVVLFALVCAKHKVAGNIPKTFTKTSGIYGFNLEVDLPVLQEFMKENNTDPELIKYFGGVSNNVTSAELINQFFLNTSAKNNVSNVLHSTDDRNIYNTMRKVYKSLVTVDQTNDMYTMKNGEVADTYLDYVENFNYVIYQLIKNVIDEYDINKIDEYIDEVLTALSLVIASEKFNYLYTNISNISGDNIKRYIYKMIGFFKSFTVQLDSLSTIYTIDDKVFNAMRQFDKLVKAKTMETGTGQCYDNIDTINVSANKVNTTKVTQRCELVFRRGGSNE